MASNFKFINDSEDNISNTSRCTQFPGEKSGPKSSSVDDCKSCKSQTTMKNMVLNQDGVGEPTATISSSSCKSSHDVTKDAFSHIKNEHIEVPLGYEPEGSVASSSPQSENSSPPHLRWAENLHSLLSDSEGVVLFKEFLEQEHNGPDDVQFWFACQGLKRKAKKERSGVPNIVKVIYKTYIRCDKVKCISAETKKEIVSKLNRKSNIDECVFDKAQREVETYLREVSYPAFLLSDVYVQYINNYADSPKASLSFESNASQPVSLNGTLPVLLEEKELCEQDVLSDSDLSLLSNKTTGRHQSQLNNSRATETAVGFLPFKYRNQPYKTHVSYAPVSLQDSELQSLSSDALTDDTMSITDSSSANGSMTYSQRRYFKVMKTHTFQNKELKMGVRTQFIPRTERVPKGFGIAEKNPPLFAQILVEKLNKEVEKREVMARMEGKLNMLRQDEEGGFSAANRSFSKNSAAPVIPIVTHPGLQEENAESILDSHCSRVWSSSPGCQSPLPKYSERTVVPWFKPKPGHLSTSLCENFETPTAARTNSRSHHHRNKKDHALSKSFDSGMSGGAHRHVHHHHHHHFSRDGGKQRAGTEAQQGSLYWREPQSVEHCRTNSSSAKKSSGRKSSASSNVDSGISTLYETDSSYAMSSWSNPSSDRDMKRLTASDPNKSSASCDSSDLGLRSCFVRRSHRSTSSAAVSQPYRQSSKGKMVHPTGRSASMEHGGVHTMGMPSSSLPNHTKDFNKLLQTTGTSVTYSEEAKHRHDESFTSGSIRCKSVMGLPPKENTRNVPVMTSMPPPAYVPPVRALPGSSSVNMSESCPSSHPSRPASTSSQGHAVVVGMFYDQESYPFRFSLPGPNITLEQIRRLNTKKGNYKYFFKRACDEFGDGAVFEELNDDTMLVPLWEGKVVTRLQKVD